MTSTLRVENRGSRCFKRQNFQIRASIMLVMLKQNTGLLESVVDCCLYVVGGSSISSAYRACKRNISLFNWILSAT